MRQKTIFPRADLHALAHRCALWLTPLDGKKPILTDWTNRKLTQAELLEYRRDGCNFGVVAGLNNLLIIDVDVPHPDLPKKAHKVGHKSYRKLCRDLTAVNGGVEIDLARQYPTVRSGGGGLHIYMRAPAGVSFRGEYAEYKDLDFIKAVQVAAPGSYHPDTGNQYTMLDGWTIEDLREPPPPPPAMMELLGQAVADDFSFLDGDLDDDAQDAGRISGDRLAELLVAIPYVTGELDTRTNAGWLKLAQSCHAACNTRKGGMVGFKEFNDWCLLDAEYFETHNAQEITDSNKARWRSFDPTGGISAGLLFQLYGEHNGGNGGNASNEFVRVDKKDRRTQIELSPAERAIKAKRNALERDIRKEGGPAGVYKKRLADLVDRLVGTNDPEYGGRPFFDDLKDVLLAMIRTGDHTDEGAMLDLLPALSGPYNAYIKRAQSTSPPLSDAKLRKLIKSYIKDLVKSEYLDNYLAQEFIEYLQAKGQDLRVWADRKAHVVYNGNCWRQADEKGSGVPGMIQEFLNTHHAGLGNMVGTLEAAITRVLNAKAEIGYLYRNDPQDAPWRGAYKPDDTHNVANGTLYFDLAHNHFEFVRGHDPSDNHIYCADYDYNPSAICPVFITAVNLWLGSAEPDTKQLLVEKLQEVVMYSLLYTRTGAVVFLHGTGGNGKSTFIDIMKALLGTSNYTEIKPAKGGEDTRFNISTKVIGRKMVTVSDAKVRRIGDEYIKGLSSNEETMAEDKGRDAVPFINTAFPLLAVNRVPHFDDTGESLSRRLLVLPFNTRFDGNLEARDQLTNIMLAATNAPDTFDLARYIIQYELPGVLNWALEAWPRLVASRGVISGEIMAPQLRHIRDQIISGSDSIKDFLARFFIVTKQPTRMTAPLPNGKAPGRPTIIDRVPCGVLFEAYRAWCAFQGVPNNFIKTRNNFIAAVDELLGREQDAGRGPSRIGGRVMICWPRCIFAVSKFELELGKPLDQVVSATFLPLDFAGGDVVSPYDIMLAGDKAWMQRQEPRAVPGKRQHPATDIDDFLR